MPSLIDLRRRVRAVKNTQQITKAMKMVAASKLRRAQERIMNARPYAVQMQRVLASVAARVDKNVHPFLAVREKGPNSKTLVIVVTADKGLCGAFNSNVLRASLAFIRETGNVDVTLVVVGRKARDFYRRREWAIKAEMQGFFDRLAYSHAQEIAAPLMESYLAGETDEVHLIYNEFRSVAVQRVTRHVPLRHKPYPVGRRGDNFGVLDTFHR